MCRRVVVEAGGGLGLSLNDLLLSLFIIFDADYDGGDSSGGPRCRLRLSGGSYRMVRKHDIVMSLATRRGAALSIGGSSLVSILCA